MGLQSISEKDRKETGNIACGGVQGMGELGTSAGACNRFPFSIFKTLFNAAFYSGIILHSQTSCKEYRKRSHTPHPASVSPNVTLRLHSALVQAKKLTQTRDR